MRKLIQGFLIFVFAIILVIFCGGLLLKQLTESTVEADPIEVKQTAYTQEEFIKVIAPTATKIAQQYGLYASVMIAQATLESDAGNSELASAPNYNLFGMKGIYNGNSVLFPTQEDDGKGNLTTIHANFRKYPSYKASMTDYAELLKNGTSWNKSYYHDTFMSNTASYKDATKALTGKYATDSRYNIKLNALIQQYNLVQYD